MQASGYSDLNGRVEDETMAVERAMQKPETVLTLDMWDAADKLRQKEGLQEEVISRLIDIQYELVGPYAEVRAKVSQSEKYALPFLRATLFFPRFLHYAATILIPLPPVTLPPLIF